MPPALNPLDHELLTAPPGRLTPHSEWQEHIPFAFVLVDLARPRVLVELGTQAGDSYCAFCQAVQALELDTRCHAVDTWVGDEHAGFYGAEILEDLRVHHDPRYGDFSTLIQGTFDDALVHFEDGSVDLLHIDGAHTYEAVKHDWETWRPKLSSRGVALFHDINERHSHFGVWKLWSEVKADGPRFELRHGHGLGLLAVGADAPEAVLRLCAAPEDEAARIRALFHRLGRAVAAEGRMAHTAEQRLAERQAGQDRAAEERSRMETHAAALEEERDALERHVAALEAERSALEDAVGRLENERGKLEARLAAVEARLAAVEAQLAAVEAQLGDTESERARLAAALEETTSELSRRTAERDAAQARDVRAWAMQRSWADRARLALPWRWDLLERAMKDRW